MKKYLFFLLVSTYILGWGQSNFNSSTSYNTSSEGINCNAPDVPIGTISGDTPACNTTILSFSGTAPTGITYYWQSSDSGIDKSNNASGTLAVNISGTYYVRAFSQSEDCWSVATNGYTVVINNNPVITVQPNTTDLETCRGIHFSTTTLSVTATGSNLTYQWYSNTINSNTGGTIVTGGGALTPTLSIPNNIVGDYYYYCEISGTSPCSEVVVSNVSGRRTVISLPEQPAGLQSNSPQCVTEGVTISYTGTPGPDEIWYWQGLNGNGTSEADGNPTFMATASGTYYIRSKNTVTGCWSYTSSISVIVNPITSITTQPTDQNVILGDLATFKVISEGVGLQFQWQVSTDGGVNWSNITSGSGSYTSSYTTTDVTAAMQGNQYRVVITGPCGDLISDGNATLNIVERTYLEGDYRSYSNGAWRNQSGQSLARWERYIDGSWQLLNQGVEPIAGENTRVYIQHNIEVPATATQANVIGYLHVLSGGRLLHRNAANQWDYRNLIIDNKGTLQLYGFFRVSETFEIKNGGNFILYSDTSRNYLFQRLFAGTEIFHPNSNFIINVIPGNKLLDTSLISMLSTNSDNAYFGNIVVEPYTNLVLVANDNYQDTMFNYALCNDLIFKGSSTNKEIIIYEPSVGYIRFFPLTINRNLIIEDTFRSNIHFTKSSTAYSYFNFRINYDFINNSPMAFVGLGNQTNNNAVYHFSVGRNMVFGNSARFIFRDATSAISRASINLNIAGNLSNIIGGFIYDESTGANIVGTINFNGMNPQLIEFVTGNTNTRVHYNINNGANVKLGRNLTIGANSLFTISGSNPNQFGTFDASTFSLRGSSGNNKPFKAESYSVFKTANLNGFSGGTNTSISGAIGITLQPNSTVEYYADVDQIVTNQAFGTSPNQYNYQNLVISGSGVKSGNTGNIIVNQLTKVEEGAKFRILETADDATPNVLTAKGGITVSSAEGSELVLENNANLMQTPEAPNSGNITLVRNSVVPSNQYNYWSSPVKNQNIYTLYENIPANRAMTYNTLDDFFINMPNPTNAGFGVGYSIKGPSSNAPLNPNGTIAVSSRFVGTPHNQSLTSTIENEILLSNVGNGYNLIGNPYPSNLDLQKVYQLNGNTAQFADDESGKPTFYFWDNVGNTAFSQMGPEYEDYGTNNYASYNPNFDDGTAADNPNASGKKPNGIVKPGQGFIIRAAPNATKLVMGNTMRTTLIKRPQQEQNAPYYKGENNPSLQSSRSKQNDKFWIELINPDQIYLQIALGYFTLAENSFDHYDTPVLNENTSDLLFSFSSDNRKLTIQGRKGTFSDEDIIPIGIKTFKQGIYKIQLGQVKGIFESSQQVFLKDKELDLIHNLSESAYEIELEQGAYFDRFELVFKGDENSGPVLTTASGNNLKIEKQDHHFVVSSNPQKIHSIEIFNLQGASIYKSDAINANSWKIPYSTFEKGILVVNIRTETGEMVSKKIINYD